MGAGARAQVAKGKTAEKTAPAAAPAPAAPVQESAIVTKIKARKAAVAKRRADAIAAKASKQHTAPPAPPAPAAPPTAGHVKTPLAANVQAQLTPAMKKIAEMKAKAQA